MLSLEILKVLCRDLPPIHMVNVYDFRYFDRCEVISHGGFNFNFLMANDNIT